MTTYEQAYALAVAQGHPVNEQGVWPSVERNGVRTTGLISHPDSEDAAEICAELGDAHGQEWLDALRRSGAL